MNESHHQYIHIWLFLLPFTQWWVKYSCENLMEICWSCGPVLWSVQCYWFCPPGLDAMGIKNINYFDRQENIGILLVVVVVGVIFWLLLLGNCVLFCIWFLWIEKKTGCEIGPLIWDLSSGRYAYSALKPPLRGTLKWKTKSPLSIIQHLCISYISILGENCQAYCNRFHNRKKMKPIHLSVKKKRMKLWGKWRNSEVKKAISIQLGDIQNSVIDGNISSIFL